MGKAAVGIDLTGPERRELEGLAQAQKTGQALAPAGADRARGCLGA